MKIARLSLPRDDNCSFVATVQWKSTVPLSDKISSPKQTRIVDFLWEHYRERFASGLGHHITSYVVVKSDKCRGGPTTVGAERWGVLHSD